VTNSLLYISQRRAKKQQQNTTEQSKYRTNFHTEKTLFWNKNKWLTTIGNVHVHIVNLQSIPPTVGIYENSASFYLVTKSVPFAEISTSLISLQHNNVINFCYCQ